jgi:hypothetical protein
MRQKVKLRLCCTGDPQIGEPTLSVEQTHHAYIAYADPTIGVTHHHTIWGSAALKFFMQFW